MKKILTLALLAGAMAVQTTQASFILYTNQTQFISQLSSSYIDDYSDFSTDGGLTSPTNRTDGIFSYQVTGGDYAVIGSGYTGGAISTGQENADIVFDSFLGNVSAVGGLFFLTELNFAKTNGTLTVTLNGVGTSTNIQSNISQQNQFIGWVATGGDVISSITVSTSSGQYNTVDDFTIGQAIPEPAVITLISLFSVGALFVRRLLPS